MPETRNGKESILSLVQLRKPEEITISFLSNELTWGLSVVEKKSLQRQDTDPQGKRFHWPL